eukprot:GGOE01061219.1.p1 GENE.GGOE01061219.1~~GGOE01061219.1.p1  ORF type:complete len:286 (+),score=24.68 GGOE01061219.1:48-905(+)
MRLPASHLHPYSAVLVSVFPDNIARASAFALSFVDAKVHKLHLVSCAHVTHPHQFPALYPHNKYPSLATAAKMGSAFQAEGHALQCRRQGSGAIIASVPLSGQVFKHPSLDLVVLHFRDPRHALRFPLAAVNLQPTTLFADSPLAYAGHEFVEDSHRFQALQEQQREDGDLFVGHPGFRLREDFHNYSRSMFGGVLMPRIVRGAVSNYCNAARCLGHTDDRLEMGLCGGPVVEDVLGSEGPPTAVGMLEGMVSAARDPALEGMAAFIPADAILDFCRHVEKLMNC